MNKNSLGDDIHNPDIVDQLIKKGVLSTPAIIEAFKRASRQSFVPSEHQDEAQMDAPLPIGFGQTVSQPWTVAFMLEALQVQPGDNVLDVGAGSGWTAALLAELVGPEGHVVAVERIPQLRHEAEENVRTAGYPDVEFVTADGSLGWPEQAPYNCIHVAAAARHGILPALKKQLAVGGRLVIPVGSEVQDIVVVDRFSEEKFIEQRHPGFQFVPLIEGQL